MLLFLLLQIFNLVSTFSQQTKIVNSLKVEEISVFREPDFLLPGYETQRWESEVGKAERLIYAGQCCGVNPSLPEGEFLSDVGLRICEINEATQRSGVRSARRTFKGKLRRSLCVFNGFLFRIVFPKGKIAFSRLHPDAPDGHIF